jgi:hypothetical protein
LRLSLGQACTHQAQNQDEEDTPDHEAPQRNNCDVPRR